MGDKLPSVETSVSKSDNSYSMWDRIQLLVIFTRKKLSKNDIFVGNKESTLNALVCSLKNRKQ